MRKLLTIALLAAAVIFTLPLWGSCDLNARVCSAWCGVRHLDSDIKTASCNARCESVRPRCLTDRGISEVQGFVDGLKR